MRSLLAASLGASLTVVSLAAAGPAVEPLPANARSLANDVASKSTAEEKAWAADAGRRRPLPGYEALKSEVRTRFATRRRMSELEVDRLAFLGVVMGFDDGVAGAPKHVGVAPTPTLAPSASRRAKAPAFQAGSLSNGAEVSMVNLQSLVSQRQIAVQLTTQIMGRLNESSRTVAANIGR